MKIDAGAVDAPGSASADRLKTVEQFEPNKTGKSCRSVRSWHLVLRVKMSEFRL